MKKCSCCGKFKTESEFYRNKRNKDSLTSYCKNCHNLMVLGMKAWKIRGEEPKANFNPWRINGGLRITVLNHTKPGEFVYNILYVGEDKEPFSTNNKTVFKQRLDEALEGGMI